MNLFEFVHTLFASFFAALTIFTLHQWLGWALIASTAVGFIPGLILGYIVGIIPAGIVELTCEGIRRVVNRNKRP